ncbi:alpha/beta fold hydrolase [Paenibacillus sp. SI8]|uniref:alpha/beta fold hydrolase n=1 Tax=unclassified Paenibacillus TaxID=185978 RepID=UPI003466CC10
MTSTTAITRNQLHSFTSSNVTSQDGTLIGYQSIGNGPGVIIIPGALSTSNEFTSFARELSDSFTAHVIDRRGRGNSGPQGKAYSIIKECEDLKALQEETGATYLFGHSYGGLVALETARTHSSFTKIALYEPGVSIQSEALDWNWITEYETAMDKQDFRGAFTSFARGSGHTPLNKFPKWYASFMLRLFVRGDHWHQIQKLLPENLNEHREVRRLENTFSNYQTVLADLLLLSGQKSPAFVHQMIDVLDQTIAHTQTMKLPKLHHLSPENEHSPLVVARAVKDYFLNK